MTSTEDSWPGLNMLMGGKGYVTAPLGQLHYRDVGPRESHGLLLLHQSPQSMVEFGAVQNSLVRRGLRSIAVDTPGYGSSDPPPGQPTIGEFADNLISLLDALQLATVTAAGHHTGACIATALAMRHPRRVTGVILHGCPLYSAEEAEVARNKHLYDRVPVADGSHLSQIFKWKGVGDHGDLLNRTWMSIALFQQGRDLGHRAVAHYDMQQDLSMIRARGLIISEVDDVTHHMDQRARALRPDFEYRQLPGPGMSTIMTDPDAWAEVAAAFARG